MVQSMSLKQKIVETGIGYGEQHGVTWLMGTEPFVLPKTYLEQLQEIEELISWMSVCIKKAYNSGHSKGLKKVLTDKVPERIPQLSDGKLERLFRLDIAVDGNDRLYVTEREECPGAKGLVYALAQGYDVPYDIAEKIKHAMPKQSSSLYILLTRDWWEYEQDLRVFAYAMQECGIECEVYYADEVDVKTLPEKSTLHLFGYFDNFLKEKEKWVLDSLSKDVYVLNPRAFYRESKVLLALPFLDFAEEIFPDQDKLARLRKYIPWTIPLSLYTYHKVDWGNIIANRQKYIIKDAGYDGNNTSWGARGVYNLDHSSKTYFAGNVQWGLQAKEWVQKWNPDIAPYLYPQILQEKVQQRTFSVSYYTENGDVAHCDKMCIRISPFIVQIHGRFEMANTLLVTFSKGNKVHGTPESIMVPALLEQ